MRMIISCAAILLRLSERYLFLDLRRGTSALLSCAVSASLLLAAQACADGSADPAPNTADTSTAAVTRSPTPSAAPSLSASPVPTPVPTAAAAPVPTVAPTPSATARADDAPAPSVSLLTAVDKQQALPAGYVPPDLVAVDGSLAAPGFGGLLLTVEANGALSAMLAATAAGGHDIRVRSAYRSYAEQERTFAYWVSVLGEAEARRVSAEAGHSEHQLGTTVDLTAADVGHDLTEAFGEAPAGRWLAENAHLYGFALSYPAGAEAVTGYVYEPWHHRYIGVEHAPAWRASGLTLGEYLRGLE